MAAVVIGVDPAKRSDTIEVIDKSEAVLLTARFDNTNVGYRQLRTQARRWPDRVWAVEGATGVGLHLAQRLVSDGERVGDVPSKLSTRMRAIDTGHGRKNDPTDAHAVDDQMVALRPLSERRRDLVRSRTQAVNLLAVSVFTLAACAAVPATRTTPTPSAPAVIDLDGQLHAVPVAHQRPTVPSGATLEVLSPQYYLRASSYQQPVLTRVTWTAASNTFRPIGPVRIRQGAVDWVQVFHEIPEGGCFFPGSAAPHPRVRSPTPTPWSSTRRAAPRRSTSVETALWHLDRCHHRRGRTVLVAALDHRRARLGHGDAAPLRGARRIRPQRGPTDHGRRDPPRRDLPQHDIDHPHHRHRLTRTRHDPRPRRRPVRTP